MSHFVNIKEIDGFEVIVGFAPPSINPVESWQVVDPLLKMTDEYKQAESLSMRFGQLERKRLDILRTARANKDPSKRSQIDESYKNTTKEQAEIQKQAVEGKPAFNKKRQALLKENAVYFDVPGCKEITLKELGDLSDKIQSLKTGQFLTMAGRVLNDNRGKEYWFQSEFGEWIFVIIKELDEGIPAGAIKASQLSEKQRLEIVDQKNVVRISKLTREQRADERERYLKKVLTQAAHKKTEFEIEGSDDPLEQSRHWYEEEKAKVEHLYK